ncbi:MAG: BA14K family protein [Pseudomonadota bacterium]
MARLTTKLFSTATAVAMIAAPLMAAAPSVANAGERHWNGHRWVYHNHHRPFARQFKHRQHHHHRGRAKVDNSTGLGVALGVLGTVVVLDALNKSQTYQAPKQPRYNYGHVPQNAFPPAPNSGPQVVYHSQSLEPWTPGWRAWCQQRYRSFNASTGTYRGYDGYDHFCVPK